MRTGKKGPGPDLAKGLADLKRLRKQALSQAVAVPALAPLHGHDAKARQVLPGRPLTQNTQGLSQADIALFRRTMKLVTPLKGPSRIALPATLPVEPEQLRARRLRAVGHDARPLVPLSDLFQPARSTQDDSHYVRDRHASDLIKGLKRGKWAINATLDLHGSTLDQARDRLDRFIQSCLAHHLKCVRIVHGKGYGSREGEPVLKQSIRRWLAQLDCVIAYTECAERDGGTGAVQVLLRLPAQTPDRTEAS